MQRNVLYCMYTCTPFIPIVVSFIFQTLLSLFFKSHNLKPPIDIGELTRPRCDVTKLIWMVSKGTILAPKMAEDFKLVKYYSSRYILAHHIHPEFATKMVQGGATLLCLVHKPYEVQRYIYQFYHS